MQRSAARILRSVVRDATTMTAAVLTAPLWIPVRAFARFDSKDSLFLGCSELLSLFPGLPGIVLRRGFYLMTLDEFGWDCTVEFGTWFAHRRTRVGRGVYIGGRCTLGMCSIGDQALLGSNVDIIAGRHTHSFDDLSKPIASQREQYDAVNIGRNCWLGNSTVIMADVGDHTVVGAGSVVIKPIPASVVAAGNPCTVKKSRLPDNQRAPTSLEIHEPVGR
jgi:acetyltransferase-like isoleucine patch superfamily enzyme